MLPIFGKGSFVEWDKIEQKGLLCPVSFTGPAWLPQVLWQPPTPHLPPSLVEGQARAPSLTRTRVSQGPAATANKDEDISKDIAPDLLVQLPWTRICNSNKRNER